MEKRRTGETMRARRGRLSNLIRSRVLFPVRFGTEGGGGKATQTLSIVHPQHGGDAQRQHKSSHTHASASQSVSNPTAWLRGWPTTPTLVGPHQAGAGSDRHGGQGRARWESIQGFLLAGIHHGRPWVGRRSVPSWCGHSLTEGSREADSQVGRPASDRSEDPTALP